MGLLYLSARPMSKQFGIKSENTHRRDIGGVMRGRRIPLMEYILSGIRFAKKRTRDGPGQTPQPDRMWQEIWSGRGNRCAQANRLATIGSTGRSQSREEMCRRGSDRGDRPLASWTNRKSIAILLLTFTLR